MIRWNFQRGRRYGIDFVRKHLKQYFPVIALWRYHRFNKYQLADTALLDSFQGKVTKAWKYVGNEFDINVVPHGDLTYPAISTADILAYKLSSYLPPDEPFAELVEIGKQWLITHKSEESDPYVGAEPITKQFSDHIVPDVPYSMRPALHYPHPVTFIHNDIFSEQFPLEKTDFHALARRRAFENHGSVVSMHNQSLSSILRDGDRIVYTTSEEHDDSELLSELHATRDIGVVGRSEFWEEAQQSLGQWQ